MFVDEVKIAVKAGSGGNGASTFRREKYVPRGGPDGGDGGTGGSVYLLADANATTLLDFRYKHLYKATPGDHGQRSNKHGKNGADLVLAVPVGTVVRDSSSGAIVGDMVTAGEKLLVAAGGRGGRGNARFTSSTNQAPRFAENGEPGQERDLELELKVLADVGLVGLPNAGKSSLLNRISAARPKIADYPFTTLVPILGVVSLGDHRSCVVADIPGLIEGAHQGLGLGHQFLRHIERTRILIHVLDGSGGDSGDPMQNFQVVNDELASHSAALARLPMLVAVNKIDITSAERVEELCSDLEARGFEVMPISAATGEGVERLLYRVADILSGLTAAPTTPDESDERVVIEAPKTRRRSREWAVVRDPDGAWRVTGEGLERVVAMTNVDNESALGRLDRILERNGIMDALKRAGVKDGANVRIGRTEFVFVEEERVFGSRRRKKPEEDAANGDSEP